MDKRVVKEQIQWILLSEATQRALPLCSKKTLTSDEASIICEAALRFIHAGIVDRTEPIKHGAMVCVMIFSHEDASAFFTLTSGWDKSARIVPPTCIVCKTNKDDKCSCSISHPMYEAIAECGLTPPHGFVWIASLFVYNGTDVGFDVASYGLGWHNPQTRLLYAPARNHAQKCRLIMCSRYGSSYCARCKNDHVRYCSKECQTQDWAVHKLECH